MRLVKRTCIAILLGGWMGLAPAGIALAETDSQDTTSGTASDGWVAKADWQQRVLQRGPTTHSGPEQAATDQQRSARWSASRGEEVRPASLISSVGEDEVMLEEIAPGEEQILLAPLPPDYAYDSGGSEFYTTDSCGYCGNDCCHGGGCYGGCAMGLATLRSAWWMQNLSLMAGVQGFKGPFDQGRNGNFGLHEGVNFGAPLGGPWGWGYQVGFLTTQSNLSGDQAGDHVRRAARNQFFFTAGVFCRAPCSGWQWGVAFDLLRDTYYANADVTQVRTEIGYVLAGGCAEIGYWGAYGTGGDEVILGETNLIIEPTDLFAFYYRRHFSTAAEGRLWAGFTGCGDGLLGADLRIPLGGGLAIENCVNYLIPDEGKGVPGQREESWGLSIRLVWNLGQSARCAQQSPYRPLLGIADNSLLMVDALGDD